MGDPADRPELAIRRLVNGYQITQALSVAATLGIADLLVSGPRSSDDLATVVGAHPDALYRLLRALASIGVFHEEPDRQFRVTDLGAILCTDAPASIRGWAAFVGDPYHWHAWGGLLHSVQTGENAFRHVHGTDPWTLRAQHPAASAVFDRAMTSLSRQVAGAVVEAFAFGRFTTIVDVAGGNGAFLATILSRYPQVQGVLFDQPHVVSGAGSLLATAGVADRCTVVGGSFFIEIPQGGDAYVLKAILHDWEETDCLRILRVCRQAMAAGTALLIVERELGGPNERWEDKFSDLNMLAAPGGRERTTEEYAALVEAAGFRFVGATPCASGQAVFESVAV
jgi:hypothetical protein